MKSTIEYINDNPQSSLDTIDVVIFSPDMVNDFVESMKKFLDKDRSFISRVRIKIEKWASYFLGDADGMSFCLCISYM